jgi:hypothetical protein
MESKVIKWYIKFPADAYAMGPIDFHEDDGEKEVRQYAREFDGCKRLPQGFECWLA